MLAPDPPAGLSVVYVVEVHLAHIFEKMGVKSAVELANRLRDHDGVAA
jgi:DNA-binding NarL/FixJ family response regulator